MWSDNHSGQGYEIKKNWVRVPLRRMHWKGYDYDDDDCTGERGTVAQNAKKVAKSLNYDVLVKLYTKYYVSDYKELNSLFWREKKYCNCLKNQKSTVISIQSRVKILWVAPLFCL